MKSSNTSPNRWLLAGLCCVNLAYAADALRGRSQYIRDRWGPDKGFSSGPVYAITQTTDGYLWVGAEAGLVRFDGLAFKLMRTADPQPFSLAQVLGLTGGGDGSLWVRRRGLNLLRYHDGAFDDMTPALAQAGVTVVIRADNGDIIFATTRGGVFLLRGSKMETLLPPQSMLRSPVISLARSPGGDVFMGTRDLGLVHLRGGNVSVITEGLPNLKIDCLIAESNNSVWIGTGGGVVRWDGDRITRAGVPSSLERVQALAMARSGDGNIWVGTAGQGLFLIDRAGLSTLVEPPGGAITAVFEDREGDVWIAGDNRIERLRRGIFATYLKADGLPSDTNGPVYADAEDRVWFGPESGGLWSIERGKIARFAGAGLDRDIVYSIAGRGSDLWVARQRGGLTHVRLNGGPLVDKTYTHADGLAQDTVFAVNVNRDGTVWAGTLNGGVSRLRDGRFTTYTTRDGLASDTVYSILEGSGGTMWFATPRGLSALSQDRWRTYTVADGLPSENVNTLFEDAAGTLWIGTLRGLAYFRSGRIQVPNATQPPLYEQIMGIAEDKQGALWIGTGNHVMRIHRDRLQNGNVQDEDLRQYDLADGLRSLAGVRRHRSVASDPGGRIWFSTTRGLSVVDTAGISGGSAPAIVHIQALIADGSPIPLEAPVRIPGGRQRIALDYTGLSLGIPERTRFRYILEGFDHGWSEPVADREAVYTNLGPRKYRFRVISSNLDQVFNSVEATLNFEIEPMFWQSWWFRGSALLLLGLSITAFLRFRTHRLTQQMNLRFEERLAERTRIAQELHDTLLQGFLSASMQLHVAADRLPKDSPAKQPLGRILELMSRVMGEGRSALQDLRSASADSLDLELAFSRIQQELHVHEDVRFSVVAEGQPRPLHPILRDEVYRIGREALVNAFRHSHATRIEVELEYSARHLRVLVRDNGCGIDTLVLQSGREGHWGLSGMRERAEKMGARLHVWSRLASGTEVELSVPSHVAFTSAPRRRNT